jgi:hypothetical protein
VLLVLFHQVVSEQWYCIIDIILHDCAGGFRLAFVRLLELVLFDGLSGK